MGMTDLERICGVLDADSFSEFFPGEPCGYVTGHGLSRGRPVVVCVTRTRMAVDVDLRVSLQRYIQAQGEAARRRCPLVVMLDSAAPLPSGKGQYGSEPDRLLLSPWGNPGRMYKEHAILSGEVPQVGVLFGEVNAALSFPLALCDVLVLVRGSAMRIGPPALVAMMTGRQADPASLGGAAMQCQVTATGDLLAASEDEALEWVREYLDAMPTHRTAPIPTRDPVDPLPWPDEETLLPVDPAYGFDVKPLLRALVDGGLLLELEPSFAPETVTALARVEGNVVGLVASNSRQRGGIVFPETCRKMVHFLSLCDAFGIPLAFLADVPGFMVGEANEKDGAIRDGARLFSTLGNLRVPHLLVVLRKAYTAGLYAMGGPGFDPAGFVALPGATITTFASPLLDVLVNSPDFEDAERRGFAEMRAECAHPELLVAKGLLDGVVPRERLRETLAAFVSKAVPAAWREALVRRPVSRG